MASSKSVTGFRQAAETIYQALIRPELASVGTFAGLQVAGGEQASAALVGGLPQR
jgi:hypothetical protein